MSMHPFSESTLSTASQYLAEAEREIVTAPSASTNSQGHHEALGRATWFLRKAKELISKASEIESRVSDTRGAAE